MFRVLAAALCLAACAPAPLAGFDPVSEDPSGLVLAARLSPAPEVAPGAVLTMSATRPSGATLSEDFALREIAAPADAPEEADLFFALDPRDAARLAETRRRVALWKADAPETRGQFSVRLNAEGVGPMRSTVWISPGPGEPFTLIARNAALP